MFRLRLRITHHGYRKFTQCDRFLHDPFALKDWDQSQQKASQLGHNGRHYAVQWLAGQLFIQDHREIDRPQCGI